VAFHEEGVVSATVFGELTDAERNWVQNHLDRVSLFIDAYSPADSGQPITLKSLDRAFAA
jgi:hypothetical protein